MLFLGLAVIIYIGIGTFLWWATWDGSEWLSEFDTPRERVVCLVWFLIGWPHLLWRYGGED